jgi:hypothetical protein
LSTYAYVLFDIFLYWYYGTYRYTAWKFENVKTLALLKGLRLVHFFRGPLKELANAISGSPQAAARR